MILDARLGLTLIHFIWQGALLGLVLWVLLPAFRDARVRYGLSLAFLAAAAIAPVATHWLSGVRTEFAASDIALPAITGPAPASPAPAFPSSDPRPEWIARVPAVWMAGVALLSLRLLVSWWAARRLLRVGCSPLENRWEHLARRMGIATPVRFLESARAAVPAMIGVFRPVVLLPAAVMAKLPVEQLEAVIAHELAHIRRYDYLVNWIQTLVETVLFYHPAVWWISAVARREREVCCDRMAIEACGHEAPVLAHALLELEALRSAPAAALSAAGGDLEARVRRMLGETPGSNLAPVWTLAAIAALAALVLLPDRAASQAKPDPKPVTQTAAPDPRDAELKNLRLELARAKAELERAKSELKRKPIAVAAEAGPVPTGADGAPQPAPRKLERKKLIEEIKAKVRQAQIDAVTAAIASAFSQPPVQVAQPGGKGPQGPYRRWADEDVVYIITPEERAEFERLSSEAEIHAFIDSFWKKRDPSPGTGANEAKEEHYRRIAWANERLGMRGIAGWRTHRGKMYIVSGPPDEIRTWPGNEEIWTYRSQGGEVRRFRFDLTANSEGVAVQ